MDDEPQRILKSTGEAGILTLLVLLTLFSISASKNVKGVLMNFMIAVKNYQ